MTAEIAIMNREAVAMAADSAVTVRGVNGQKIFTSANKIFGLSSTDPVGVMIYGGTTMISVPWETIIKSYRAGLGSKSFAMLGQYADDFFNYLRDNARALFPDEAQANHVGGVSFVVLRDLRQLVDDRTRRLLEAKGSVSEREVSALLREAVKELLSAVSTAPEHAGLPVGFVEKIIRRHRSLFYQVIDDVFQKHPVSQATRRQLLVLAANLFARHVPLSNPPARTGIVIAGFGTSDLFPRLQAFTVDGFANDFLQVDLVESTDIDPMGTQAAIRAYAQGEMVYRFMEGVDPDYQIFVDGLIRNLATDYATAIVDSLPGISSTQRGNLRAAVSASADAFVQRARDVMRAVRNQSFSDPVTDLVDSLPKEELAAMAESLVNLTSFKRRISWDDETVAGPIDVAVISKGDGLVWIKRKHYFDGGLNPHYFANRYGAGSR